MLLEDSIGKIYQSTSTCNWVYIYLQVYGWESHGLEMLMIKHSKGWKGSILFSVSHGRLLFPYSLLLFSLDACSTEPYKSVGCIWTSKLRAALTEYMQVFLFHFVWENLSRLNILPWDSLPWSSVPHCCINNIQMCIAEIHYHIRPKPRAWAESLWGPFWGFMHLFQSRSEDQAALKY